MKFILVDRIDALEPGQRVVTHKALSLAEEYLADHFPTFPVLPGVLMLEAMTQASAWLARVTLDFAPSLVVLKEARNVTYKSFLAPGQIMRVESECRSIDAAMSEYNASGSVDGREIVKGRLTLRHLSLADSDAALSSVDDQLRTRAREQLALLWRTTPTTAVA
ncbi:MAG: hypothetical protein KDA32_13615 [Phycisphaerales bacterium]|nr:hypothetical protein [Phycisphaerales bacterium]